jgi:hypothetical protein
MIELRSGWGNGIGHVVGDGRSWGFSSNAMRGSGFGDGADHGNGWGYGYGSGINGYGEGYVQGCGDGFADTANDYPIDLVIRL